MFAASVLADGEATLVTMLEPILTVLVEPIVRLPRVVVPVTFNVPAIAVLPVLSATVNLSVSIVRPPLSAVAPVTVRVPAIAVLPVVSATVNALVSTVIPPFAANAPVNVVAPVTPSVPVNVVLPATAASVPTNSFLAIPTPPSTTKAPVVMLEESVVLLIST